MAKPKTDFISAVKRLLKTQKYLESQEVRAAKKSRYTLNVPSRRAKRLDRQAEEEFGKQRQKGLNLNALLRCCPPKIRSNAIRDQVTIKTLKMNRAKDHIKSMSLTYDRQHGRLQIRPHKHEIIIIPSSGELHNVKFSKAKRLSVQCDCSWFTYNCEYALTKRWGASSIMHSNGEYSIETNPSLNAQICKHLHVLLSYVRQSNL